jgi:hypothetical protein
MCGNCMVPYNSYIFLNIIRKYQVFLIILVNL